MRYLSVCAGIEAASCAWHQLGWQPAAFSEIDAFPSAVLAHHYPDVPNYGDMTRFQEWPDATVDVLVGGTPCQSFSVAGLRRGLADPRGNLMLTYLAIAARYRPEWLVWENVPGVLSSNGGRDFGALLGGLAELGYGFAYRILDAQYFGVAQRRRRVFVVANARDWRRAASVLFEPESLRGDSPPRRQTREGTAAGTGGGIDGMRWPADVASTLNAAFGSKQGLKDQHALNGAELFVPALANALTANNGHRNEISDMRNGLVAHALRAEGVDASEDGTGRGTPLVPVSWQGGSQQDAIISPDDVAPTLAFASGTHGGHHQPKVLAHAFDARQSDVIQYGDKTGPLDTDGHSMAVAFSCKDHGADAGDVAPTLRSMAHDGSHANGGGQVAVAFDLRGRDGGAQLEGPHDTANIRAASGGSSRSYVATTAVRRLTPRECERLQGFPDDYTLVPYRGKPASDGPRYKALGNSMAVPVMAWIGRRIDAVSKL